jgi:hypothetical protein
MKSIIAILGIALLLAFGCLDKAPCLPLSGTVCGNDSATYASSCLALFNGASVAHKGACTVPTCNDSDAGKDIFIKGTANGTAGVIEDACVNANTVAEAYCVGTEAQLESLTCSIGYECSNGACVKSACSDSDGGRVAETMGITSAQGINKTDECSSATALTEYFCDGASISNVSLDCGTGKECANGACRETACSAPYGDNATVAGTATKGNASYSDACETNDSVKKYYCDAGTIKNKTLACGTGLKCSAGRCTKQICTDSDGGKDAFTKGTASYGALNHTDSCVSGTVVLEYFCDTDTTINSTETGCGSGNECVDGACRAVVCAKNTTNVSKKDARYQIASFDNDTELRLYNNDAIEINNGMFLDVEGITENDTTLRLYNNYSDYQDSDALCSKSFKDGDRKSSMCSETINTMEILNINPDSNRIGLAFKEFFVTQYYTEKGIFVNWTDNSLCSADSADFSTHTSYFYPYLSGSNPDVEGKKFMLFGQEATIVAVRTDGLKFRLGGTEYDLKDGDAFQYYGVYYKVSMEFTDGGLSVLGVRPD